MRLAIPALVAMFVGLLLPLRASTRALLPIYVYDLAVNPDGKTAAIATEVMYGPYAVYIISLDGGRVVLTIRGQGKLDNAAFGVSFTPDGKTILIVDGGVRRLALPSLAPLPDLDLGVGHATVSANGKYVMSCEGSNVTVWDLSDGKVVFDEFPEFSVHRDGDTAGLVASTCPFSGDGEWIIASGEEVYYECHWRKGPCLGFKGEVEHAAFRPDGKVVALMLNQDPGGKSPTPVADMLTIQDLDDHKVLRSVKAEVPGVASSYLEHLVYSPDGKLLALGGNGLGIVEAEKGPVRRLFYSKEYPYIEHLQFTPDGKRIVFVMQRPNRVEEYKIGLWDLAANKLVWAIPVPQVAAE